MSEELLLEYTWRYCSECDDDYPVEDGDEKCTYCGTEFEIVEDSLKCEHCGSTEMVKSWTEEFMDNDDYETFTGNSYTAEMYECKCGEVVIK